MAPTGVLDPTNITVVQHLPAGTTFVSAGNDVRASCCGYWYDIPAVAANSIIGTYDAGANTVTWVIPAGYITVGQYPSYPGIEAPLLLRSFVQYNSPTFSAGNVAVSTVDITYTPLGTGTPLTLVGSSSSGNACETNLQADYGLQNPTYTATVTAAGSFLVGL